MLYTDTKNKEKTGIISNENKITQMQWKSNAIKDTFLSIYLTKSKEKINWVLALIFCKYAQWKHDRQAS